MPLFHSSSVSPHACSQATLLFPFREEPGLRVRKSQILTHHSQDQHEIMKAGMTQEPGVRTVGQNSLLSHVFWHCSSIMKVHGRTHQIRCLVQITQIMLGLIKQQKIRGQISKLGLGGAIGMCIHTHTHTHTHTHLNFSLYLAIINVI